MKIGKIISGMQTGADQGALFGAKDVGIETGGLAPKGFRTETGNNPALARLFGIREHASRDYPPRTEQNVLDSDATIIICAAGAAERGSTLTKKLCEKHRKPYLWLVPEDLHGGWPEHVAKFLWWWGPNGRPNCINFAGNRESVSPGIQQWTRQFVHLLASR